MSDSPYRSIPLANNFVYPPLQALGDLDGFGERIALHESASNDTPFTVYVSVPYCQVRCHSCHCFRGLLPGGSQYDLLEDYLACLLQQIAAYGASARFSVARCGAVYLGGGTASLLAPDQITRLIRAVRHAFVTTPDIEITLEGNPGDFTMPYLERARHAGVTRISIGYQSSNDETLRSLNSPHRASVGVASVRNALAAGFETVNVDLLFNVPGQTEHEWKDDVHRLLTLRPHGISPGDYVVFPSTAAAKLMSTGRLGTQHDIDTTYRWYQWTSSELAASGYREHLRGIFALPGHPYRYGDLACLENGEIVGLGAGAYSFIGRYQFQAAPDAEAYKTRVRAGEAIHAASLSLRATDRNLMERFVIHNLFASVLRRDRFRRRFGEDPTDVFADVFVRLERHGLATVDERDIRLTELGRKWRRNVYHEFYAPDFRSV